VSEPEIENANTAPKYVLAFLVLRLAHNAGRRPAAASRARVTVGYSK
jgi:hypothetical protein